MIDLTPEQWQELEKPSPARVRDPHTNATYVLVPTEVYERLKALLVEDRDWVGDAYQEAMAVFARDGWEDPRMDVYDSLDPQPGTRLLDQSDKV
jgi:hypothetical protein